MNNYLSDLKNAFSDLDSNMISRVIESVEKVIDSGNTIHFIGNGGSAGTPSHSAGDWSKELGVATICHTDNISSLTAWANDTSYEEIFVNQLKVYLKSGDILLAYSGSGNSENVLRGVNYAKEMNCLTIGFTGDYKGGRGGELAKIVDYPLVFNTQSMERIEDLQLIINHIVKESIKSKRNINSSC
ncbi:MAG: phosphoheptose isomerase [Euryarchaeota archaeon]|nr:phosphoheptose isomerase [Euryarchaeota archaeon]|tara:strand:+ start:687 stop:1244 length:558 start_codon:yes stop_codon:yes gene_type:complete